MFVLPVPNHASKFVFKGGFLLAYLMKIGRETVDLDFLLTRMKVEKEELMQVFEDIISTLSLPTNAKKKIYPRRQVNSCMYAMNVV